MTGLDGTDRAKNNIETAINRWKQKQRKTSAFRHRCPFFGHRRFSIKCPSFPYRTPLLADQRVPVLWSTCRVVGFHIISPLPLYRCFRPLGRVYFSNRFYPCVDHFSYYRTAYFVFVTSRYLDLRIFAVHTNSVFFSKNIFVRYAPYSRPTTPNAFKRNSSTFPFHMPQSRCRSI